MKEHEHFSLRVKNVDKLISVLNKFPSIDPTMTIDIYPNNEVLFYNYKENRSVVKVFFGVYEDFFYPLENPIDNIVIGIFNIEKIVKVLRSFKKYNRGFEYIDIVGDNDNRKFLAKSISLTNGILKHTMLMAPQTILLKKYELDTALIEKDVKFIISPSIELWNELIANMSCDAADNLDLECNSNQLILSGKSFTVIYPDWVLINTQENFSFSIEKEKFRYLDKEQYTLIGLDKGLKCVSEETRTIVVLAAQMTGEMPPHPEEIDDEDQDLFEDDDELVIEEDNDDDE